MIVLITLLIIEFQYSHIIHLYNNCVFDVLANCVYNKVIAGKYISKQDPIQWVLQYLRVSIAIIFLLFLTHLVTPIPYSGLSGVRKKSRHLSYFEENDLAFLFILTKPLSIAGYGKELECTNYAIFDAALQGISCCRKYGTSQSQGSTATATAPFSCVAFVWSLEADAGCYSKYVAFYATIHC